MTLTAKSTRVDRVARESAGVYEDVQDRVDSGEVRLLKAVVARQVKNIVKSRFIEMKIAFYWLFRGRSFVEICEDADLSVVHIRKVVAKHLLSEYDNDKLNPKKKDKVKLIEEYYDDLRRYSGIGRV